VIWSERFVPQLRENDERIQPIWRCFPSGVDGEMVAACPNVKEFHCPNRNFTFILAKLSSLP